MILNDKSSGAQKQPGPGEAVKLALQGFQRPALPPLAPSTPLQRTPSTLSDRDITDEHPKDRVAPFYFCGLAASFCFVLFQRPCRFVLLQRLRRFVLFQRLFRFVLFQRLRRFVPFQLLFCFVLLGSERGREGEREGER